MSWTLTRTTTNDPTGIHDFFNRRHRRSVKNPCNCPASQKVSSAVTVDLSADGHTEIIYVDATSGALKAADMDACRCRTLLDTTVGDRKGDIFLNLFKEILNKSSCDFFVDVLFFYLALCSG